jgi:hypothetical protein
MERPRPKELVVSWRPGGRLIEMTTSTEDACAWVRREAGTFGSCAECKDGDCVRFSLWVGHAYDIEEVVAFLRSYTA